MINKMFKHLLMAGRTDTGQQFVGKSLLPFLYIEVTFTHFQRSENIPVDKKN